MFNNLRNITMFVFIMHEARPGMFTLFIPGTDEGIQVSLVLINVSLKGEVVELRNGIAA